MQCLDTAHSPLILTSFTIAETLERKTYLYIKRMRLVKQTNLKGPWLYIPLETTTLATVFKCKIDYGVERISWSEQTKENGSLYTYICRLIAALYVEEL